MDDLLQEFLTETFESLDIVDVELVKFEQDPNNAQILSNIFRLVHTIKGTCGFLGLPRLEALAHAAETLMGKFRDGMAVTPQAVTLILQTLDRVKVILGELGEKGTEPEGTDEDVIDQLDMMAGVGVGFVGAVAEQQTKVEDAEVATYQVLERELKPGEVSLDELEKAFRETPGPETAITEGEVTYQVLERELKPGEVSLDELEKAFRDTPGPEEMPAVVAKVEQKVVAKAAEEKPKAKVADKDDGEASGEGGMKSQTLRVSVDALEVLMTTVSELVLTRNQLMEIARRHEDTEFKVPLQRLSNVTAELQDGVMKTRMQPIGNAWQKLPRIVRDLSNELGKTIDLDMHGAETELDRQVLELIKDPLTHMVRNSADHGLETPDDRVAAGKNPKGIIKLSAYHEGGHIIIEIADDGRGLNLAKIKEKIIANGLADEAALDKMTESQIYKYIFAPGFSTAAKVTNVSGRGVGMDVVKTNIDAIGGTIDLRSVVGEGSTFTIKIPLTLAIVSALIVECATHRFAIPQLAVVELVSINGSTDMKIERIKDTPVLRLRNKLLPLIKLSEMLNLRASANDTPEDNGFIVVTQVGQQTFGIVVDAVFHTEEIVVKPMSQMLRSVAMFSGNTILGDGSVIMIIDPSGIAAAVGSQVGQGFVDEEISEDNLGNTDKMISMLVFKAGGEQQKAVPLSLITRLEEIEVNKIEYSNGRKLVQYRGTLMPLIEASLDVKLRTEGSQPLLVISDDGRSMGLIVDEILDIVEDHLNIEVASQAEGVLGSAVIKGKATEILDVAYYMPMAFEDWLEAKDEAQKHSARKLMFVDDSAFFRNMLTPVLKAAGYQVTTVASAQEAIQVLKGGQLFDIIVSDIEMPGMSGFEFAQLLKQYAPTSKIPLIALSSLTSSSTLEKGKEVGFTDYVAKFDRQGLISVLKENASNKGMAA